MKPTVTYPEGTGEYRMMNRLIELKSMLTNYKSTHQYLRYGFEAIRPWTKIELKNKKLLKRLLEETDVIPSVELEVYVEVYFPKTDVGMDRAVKFIKKHERMINEIRDSTVRTIRGSALPDDTTLLERLREKISILPDNNKKRTMKKISVKKALLPYFANVPMLISWDEIYEIYRDMVGGRAVTVPVAEINFVGASPWKTRKKVQAYGDKYDWNAEMVDRNVNRDGPDSWSMKEQRKLMTHFIGSRHAFILDIMYSGTWAYYLMINVNTRKAFFAVPPEFGTSADNFKRRTATYKADDDSAMHCLNELLKQTRIKFILMDNEPAFTSRNFQKLMTDNGVQYQFVVKNNVGEKFDTHNKSRLNHSSTSLIDRLIRTLRMMNYNLGLDKNIPPSVMKWLVNEYNSSPHSTLSKHLKKSVSPDEVDSNPELERKICSSIARENWLIRSNPEYEPDKYVRVYNTETAFDKVKPKFLPGHWQVEGWENGLVKIRQNENTMKVSRWMLKS